MTAEVSPFDVLADFRTAQRHLVEVHGRKPSWYPDTETFDAYLARLDEIHVEIHTEGDVRDHGHGWELPERCIVCDSVGQVLALPMNAAMPPVTVPCPECAGLAITPAR